MAKPSKKTYVSNVLFDPEDDEHEEDEPITTNGFRSRYPPPQPKLTHPTGPTTMEETQKQLKLIKIQEIEKRTLDSATRSIATLRDCEDTGIRAAEALAHQGEQLQNTNTKLDGIINNLNDSQKHINGIKSVFSQFKTCMTRKPNPPVTQRKVLPSKRSAVPSNSKIENTLDNVSQRSIKMDNLESHPTTHLHCLDWQYSTGPVSSSQRVNDVLDDHLNEMSRHAANLKELGLVLGKQIDKQNELIDVIQNKAEVADVKIGSQNKQMNKILGK